MTQWLKNVHNEFFPSSESLSDEISWTESQSPVHCDIECAAYNTSCRPDLKSSQAKGVNETDTTVRSNDISHIVSVSVCGDGGLKNVPGSEISVAPGSGVSRCWCHYEDVGSSEGCGAGTCLRPTSTGLREKSISAAGVPYCPRLSLSPTIPVAHKDELNSPIVASRSRVQNRLKSNSRGSVNAVVKNLLTDNESVVESTSQSPDCSPIIKRRRRQRNLFPKPPHGDDKLKEPVPSHRFDTPEIKISVDVDDDVIIENASSPCDSMHTDSHCQHLMSGVLVSEGNTGAPWSSRGSANVAVVHESKDDSILGEGSRASAFCQRLIAETVRQRQRHVMSDVVEDCVEDIEEFCSQLTQPCSSPVVDTHYHEGSPTIGDNSNSPQSAHLRSVISSGHVKPAVPRRRLFSAVPRRSAIGEDVTILPTTASTDTSRDAARKEARHVDGASGTVNGSRDTAVSHVKYSGEPIARSDANKSEFVQNPPAVTMESDLGRRLCDVVGEFSTDISAHAVLSAPPVSPGSRTLPATADECEKDCKAAVEVSLLKPGFQQQWIEAVRGSGQNPTAVDGCLAAQWVSNIATRTTPEKPPVVTAITPVSMSKAASKKSGLVMQLQRLKRRLSSQERIRRHQETVDQSASVSEQVDQSARGSGGGGDQSALRAHVDRVQRCSCVLLLHSRLIDGARVVVMTSADKSAAQYEPSCSIQFNQPWFWLDRDSPEPPLVFPVRPPVKLPAS